MQLMGAKILSSYQKSGTEYAATAFPKYAEPIPKYAEPIPDVGESLLVDEASKSESLSLAPIATLSE